MKIVIGGVSNVGHEGNSFRRIKEYNSAVEGYCKNNDNCEFVDISNVSDSHINYIFFQLLSVIINNFSLSRSMLILSRALKVMNHPCKN